MTTRLRWSKRALFAILAIALPLSIQTYAQEEDEEEIFELSPFTIDATQDEGYLATTTLAGTRIRTSTRDIGASISIITEEFLEDTGATDAESLLYHVGNVEVGGVLGNFANANLDNSSTAVSRADPQRGQRIRGLVRATNTRDYFQTEIPFDTYNTARVTLNRGPNSVLFGLGSPGGIINNSTKRAIMGDDRGAIFVRLNHTGGHRETLDYNKTLIQDRFAVRVALLNEEIKFQQEPAFEDDKRFFTAWDAVLFENEGSDFLGKTRFRGSLENGRIVRNPPDVVPPRDGFSSWWDGIGSQEDLNRLLQVPGVDLTDISNQAVTSAQVLAAISAGLVTVPANRTPEEYAAIEGQFVPRTTVDRFRRGIADDDPTDGGRNSSVQSVPYFLYPAINYNSVTTTDPGWESSELVGIQGIMGRFRPNGFSTQDVRWTNAATAGAGFRSKSLSDRNVFDYHNNLLPGILSEVITDFHINQFILEQELLGGRAGFEIAWDEQSRERETFLPFDDGGDKTIRLDISENHAPGDSNYDGWADRLANENLGRPVLSWTDTNYTERTDEQDTFRFTFFGTLDFSDMIDGTFGKILGSHTLTGLYEDRVNEWSTISRRGAWWADQGKWPGSPDISNGLADNFRRHMRSQIYLGPDVRGLNSASDVRIDGYLQIPREAFPEIGDRYGIWYFDNNRNVDTDLINTWRVIEQTNSRDLRRSELESEAFILQSRFLDGHISTMYAIRNDKQTVYQRIQENTTYGDPSDPGVIPLRYDLPGINEIDGVFNDNLLELESEPASLADDDTVTWSIVGHYPEVWLGDLPWGMDLSAFYYEAESFQPAGISNNVLNQPLADPFGKTEEWGLTLELFDRRLSIKYNEFETSNSNARTGGMNGQLAQIANRFQFYLDRITSAENDAGTDFRPDGWAEDPADRTGDALLTPDTVPSNRQRISGTDADIGGFNSYEEYYAAIIAAIPPELQAARNFRVDTLESGERVDINDPIRGLNSTQDFVATGREIEVIGRLTQNLSLRINVAQQQTVITNIGPIAIPLALKIRDILAQPLPTSPGGWGLERLRDSPFQVETGTIGTRYDAVIRQMRIQQGRDGQRSQEQREWSFNSTLRYDFREGLLRGFRVGGGLRFQDEVAAGYPNKEVDGVVVPDVLNPWLGPDQWFGDFFMRYEKKIFDNKVDWAVQFNARNLYRSEGSQDIPIYLNPDGAVALTRIPVEQQYFLTNSFRF